MSVRVLQVTALAAIFCGSANAAPLQIPTNVPIVEVAQQTNTYTFTPVNETNSTIKRVVPLSDALVTGQSVSDVEPKVSTTRRLPVGTGGADVTANVKIPKANVAKALVATAKGAGKLLLPGLAALVLDELIDYGLSNIKVTPDGSLSAQAGDQLAPVSDGYSYFVFESPTVYLSAAQLCTAMGWGSPTNKSNGVYYGCDGNGNYRSIYANRNSSCPSGWFINGSSCSQTQPLRTLDESEISDFLASRTTGWPSSSARALAGMLGEPSIRPSLFTPDLDQNLTLQGPNSATGKTTKTTQPVQLVPGTNTVAAPGTPTSQTQPGTQTTTTTKTHPITYSGNNVSYTTTNTTNNSVTNNVTNVTTNETKVEEIQDDKEPDQCQKYPNTIGCKEIDFDTPEGEIPKKQIDVSWSPVDLGLGSGSCPAPVQIYENKQFSYQSTCDNLHIIKPLVIAIALFVGGMILFGGRADQ